MLDFLNRGVTPPPPPNFNETHIVLVPKNCNPKRVTEYKPISLYNIIYKLASKTLVNRLTKILPSIVNESQNAFVNGRLITDNALITFETMHHISQRKGGAMGVRL